MKQDTLLIFVFNQQKRINGRPNRPVNSSTMAKEANAEWINFHT